MKTNVAVNGDHLAITIVNLESGWGKIHSSINDNNVALQRKW